MEVKGGVIVIQATSSRYQKVKTNGSIRNRNVPILKSLLEHHMQIGNFREQIRYHYESGQGIAKTASR